MFTLTTHNSIKLRFFFISRILKLLTIKNIIKFFNKFCKLYVHNTSLNFIVFGEVFASSFISTVNRLERTTSQILKNVLRATI